ncbi:MAG: hypothetical protein MZU91_02865 [Desulfosudis oleivorans]|nr:hypothetical protein [Desulfosudis oleivorans]
MACTGDGRSCRELRVSTSPSHPPRARVECSPLDVAAMYAVVRQRRARGRNPGASDAVLNEARCRPLEGRPRRSAVRVLDAGPAYLIDAGAAGGAPAGDRKERPGAYGVPDGVCGEDGYHQRPEGFVVRRLHAGPGGRPCGSGDDCVQGPPGLHRGHRRAARGGPDPGSPRRSQAPMEVPGRRLLLLQSTLLNGKRATILDRHRPMNGCPFLARNRAWRSRSPRSEGGLDPRPLGRGP